MKLSKYFRRSSPLILGLGAVMFCSAGLLSAEEANNEWPRAYTVDDDDVVIYQPKIEKWDQKFVVARFAVGVRGKKDAQPIYGSFVARAETRANAETHMVSVYNMTTEDFKFPDAGDRLEHIKRDIAAVSPQGPLNLPMDELVAGASAGEPAGEEAVVPEGQDGPARPAKASKQALEQTPDEPQQTSLAHPMLINMQKGVAPQADTIEDAPTKDIDEDIPVVKPLREKKSTAAHDSPQAKQEPKRTTHKNSTVSKDDSAKKDNDEEAPKVTRHHEAPVAIPVAERVSYNEEPKLHVVRRVNCSDHHLVHFEKRVYVGENGEVLHHSVKHHRIVKIKRES